MNINNKELKSFIQNIEEGTLSISNIDNFGNEITVEGLIEFFDLIEQEETDLFSLKVYTTVYDKEKIKEVAKIKQDSYINAMFAAMWANEASKNNSQELSEALLGFVIFGSDLIHRVRNGYEILGYQKEDLNQQIYSFVDFLSESIKNKTFFKDISQANTQASDDVLFKSNTDDFNSIKILKSRIELASLILKDDINLLKLKNSKYKEIQESELLFLDSDKLAKLETKEETNESTLKNEDFNPFKNEDLSSFEVLEDENEDFNLLNKLKSLIGNKKEKKETLKLNNLRVKNKSEKGSSFKVSVVLFLCIALTGIGIVAATQQSKVVDDGNIAEKIVDEKISNNQETSNKKFKINRKGTNEE